MEKRSILDKKDFFYSGKTLPVKFRLNALKRLKALVKQYEADIQKALFLDLRKSDFESYATEIGVFYDEINLHISHLQRWTKKKRVSSPIAAFPARSFYRYEPYGVSLIIAPWNYPFQLVFVPLVSALAAGNCVVIKPSEISSNTSVLIGQMISEAFPKEYIEVVTGEADVSRELLALNFDFIFFTGSPRVGKMVMHAAADQLIPVILELGGKSPCIVDSTANISLAARRIIWGKLINAGQTCIAPDYLLVDEKIKSSLIEAIKFEIIQMFGKKVVDSPDYPRIINRAGYDRLKSLMQYGNILIGGETDDNQRFIAPTLLDQVPDESPLMQEEIFGPLLPVVSFTDIQDAVRFINQRPKPLALYLFTGNRKTEELILSRTSSGGVTINDTLMHFTNANLPFGGVGNSGTGSYHGFAGFEAFSHKKPVLKRSVWPDIPLRYAPFKEKIKLIKLIMR
jgi:aldehyde dehydrogenase (NAD+)